MDPEVMLDSAIDRIRVVSAAEILAEVDQQNGVRSFQGLQLLVHPAEHLLREQLAGAGDVWFPWNQEKSTIFPLKRPCHHPRSRYIPIASLELKLLQFPYLCQTQIACECWHSQQGGELCRRALFLLAIVYYLKPCTPHVLCAVGQNHRADQIHHPKALRADATHATHSVSPPKHESHSAQVWLVTSLRVFADAAQMLQRCASTASSF